MALVERMSLRDRSVHGDGDVVLGDDFVAPDSTVGLELRERRQRRSSFSLRRSPLTRKIITFNLIALNILVAGVLFLNSSRESYVVQRIDSMVAEAELVADVLEAQLPLGAPVSFVAGDGIDVQATLDGLDLRQGASVFVFDPAEALIGAGEGRGISRTVSEQKEEPRTVILDFLGAIWSGLSKIMPATQVAALV